MANVTAAMVKELRDKTGAGMMDCKAALNETAGDVEGAVDWLRKKGLAKAAKKAGRVAAEGLIGVESSGRTATVLEVNSETDFVARNDQFQAFAREAAKIALMGDGTVEALEAAHFPGSTTTVKDRLQELIATIGENMTLRRVAKLSVGEGFIASYVHNAVADGLGKIGVLVALESAGDVTQLATIGRQIAMHVAATNPAARRRLRHRRGDDRTRERDPAREERRQAGPRPAEDRRERAQDLLQGGHASRAGLRARAFEVGRAGAEGSGRESRRAGAARRLRALRARRRHRKGRRRRFRRRGRRTGRAQEAERRRQDVIPGGAAATLPTIVETSCSERCRETRTGRGARSKPFRRVLVKLSGEALMAPDGYWLHPQTLSGLAEDIAATTKAGFEIALVVGGGNIIRGARMSAAGWIDRATADAMGMLATVMNSLALETALNAAGVSARTMSAVSMPTICETYARQPALHYLDRGQVVVLAGGTGNPFFTTDTSAVLRAAELRCDAVLKATQVDGVYSADPKTDPGAKRYDRLTHDEAIARDLRVMDTAAFALARESRLPVIVGSIHAPSSVSGILEGRDASTVVAP